MPALQDEVIDDLDDKPATLNLDDDKPDAEDRGDVVVVDDAPAAAPAAASAAAAAPAAPAAAPVAAAAPDDKPVMIPKARFDEVNERMKEYAEEARQLREMVLRGTGTPAAPAAPAAPAFDVAAQEKAYTLALLDGKDDDAVAIRMKINAHIQAEAESRAEERAVLRMTKAQQQDAFASEVDAIKAAHPELDEKGAKANAEAIEFVLLKRDALIEQGVKPHNALRQASDAAARIFGFGQAQAPGPAPSPADERTIAARTRNAQAAAAQPPVMGGVGDRGTVVQREKVEDMTDEEFEALPASEKKKLRGD